MDVNEVMTHARDAMTVKRVFGDPYEKDGLTIIPVANVMGGAGAGGGVGKAIAENAAEAGTTEPASAVESGYGMGYGVRATPAGVYVIKSGAVEWKAAMDMNGLAIQRALVAIVALLVFRSIVRTLAHR